VPQNCRQCDCTPLRPHEKLYPERPQGHWIGLAVLIQEGARAD
jgi:hypothetical protein